MGLLFLERLDGQDQGRIFACKACLGTGAHAVHLSSSGDLLSKAFHSRNGPAYLFSTAVNVTLGDAETRDMTTGLHLVRDLHCRACGANVGWRYEYAYEEREKYKEGKFILERLQLVDLEAATSAGLATALHNTATHHNVNNTNLVTSTSTAPSSYSPMGLDEPWVPLLVAGRASSGGPGGGGGGGTISTSTAGIARIAYYGTSRNDVLNNETGAYFLSMRNVDRSGRSTPATTTTAAGGGGGGGGGGGRSSGIDDPVPMPVSSPVPRHHGQDTV